MTRETPRAWHAGWCVLVLLSMFFSACAARLTQGESRGIKWRVEDLTTSERAGTMPGYKGDGRVRDYRYMVVLEETRGAGMTFRKTFIGTDDLGIPVRFVIEFPLNNIPPRRAG